MELYKIIGLRDIVKEIGEEFMKMGDKDIPEISQIKNGYTNPLFVANIVKCRAKCLGDI